MWSSLTIEFIQSYPVLKYFLHVASFAISLTLSCDTGLNLPLSIGWTLLELALDVVLNALTTVCILPTSLIRTSTRRLLKRDSFAPIFVLQVQCFFLSHRLSAPTDSRIPCMYRLIWLRHSTYEHTHNILGIKLKDLFFSLLQSSEFKEHNAQVARNVVWTDSRKYVPSSWQRSCTAPTMLAWWLYILLTHNISASSVNARACIRTLLPTFLCNAFVFVFVSWNYSAVFLRWRPKLFSFEVKEGNRISV